ncbi:MAG: sugar kinase [Polyangiaceae bacterium]
MTSDASTKCRWDLVSLGEVMLRLDPGPERIHTTRSFRAWEGGGEYNVARGLRRCFGKRTAIATSLVDNPVGRLIEDLMLQGGVDLALLRFVPYDGIGRSVRCGLNFTERGFGARGAVGCSDRGNSAASQIAPGDFDWNRIFGIERTRWFHTGGIFAALGQHTAAVAMEACTAARSSGVTVSYDLNYRDSLWKGIGGAEQAQKVNREIVRQVDVLFGNEEDFSAALGFEVEGTTSDYSNLAVQAFQRMIERVIREYPNIRTVATTLRTAKSATVNAWGAIAFSEGRFYVVPQTDVEIFDRVGGGDSFASGFIYGLLEEKGAEWALRCGVAHGTLAMTTPGDTSMASISEVQKLMKGASARIER